MNATTLTTTDTTTTAAGAVSSRVEVSVVAFMRDLLSQKVNEFIQTQLVSFHNRFIFNHKKLR